MNKKTLIFLLSAMLFLTTSFIVYSWTEPTTPMPGGYTAPLNTSATAQNKVGELGAASFVDADDSNYYINPSGDSIMSGNVTTSGNIITARPTESDQVTTKGYVDEQIALVRSIVTGAQTLVNGAHTWNECEAAGGTVVDSDVELKQCRFELTACPSGWNQYNNFSEVLVTTAYCYSSFGYLIGSCATPQKPWGNQTFGCSCMSGSPTQYYEVPCCDPDGPSTGCWICLAAPRNAIGCF